MQSWKIKAYGQIEKHYRLEQWTHEQHGAAILPSCYQGAPPDEEDCGTFLHRERGTEGAPAAVYKQQDPDNKVFISVLSAQECF